MSYFYRLLLVGVNMHTQLMEMVLPIWMSLAPALALTLATAGIGRPPLVIDEARTVRTERPPHGAIGMSTVWRISDEAPGRTMDFRKRQLHVGAAIGPHAIDHDEVYYVLDGEGLVTSGGQTKPIRAGSAAYLYKGQTVGIAQAGKSPLTLIIAYPLPTPAQ